jgi:hypothetical protein
MSEHLLDDLPVGAKRDRETGGCLARGRRLISFI